ncbi:MAG TPA: TIGR02281 family clan AA aspartic protease [Burkholderiales bacterium]
MPHFIALSFALGFPFAGVAAPDVALIGVIGDKAAVLAVDGGEPKTVKVGQTWNGIGVVSVGRERATVKIEGKERVLLQGPHYRSGAPTSGRESVTLAADTRGQFFAEGAVNGVAMRFIVDTGATLVSLPASEAKRLGIDYEHGQRGSVQTANGPVQAYRVRLERVKLGAIDLAGVDGLVIEQGLPVALLGMSFLNRVEMRRDGDTMTLVRRF